MTRLVPTPVRREPGTLVTGSGRSGTKWLAEVLHHAGVSCGHEGWWTLGDERTTGLDVDVSWLGCFDRGYTGRVLAQARDPRTCIPSIYAAEANDHRYHLLRSQNVILSGNWAVDACRIWVTYTERAVERAEVWWLLEANNAPLLADVFDLDYDRLSDVIDAAPRNLNHRPGAEFTWPDDPILHEVRGLAITLGYDVEGIG